MNKGRVSEKEGSHRRQRLTKPGSHRRQGLTEARVSRKAKSHRGSRRKASQKTQSRPLNKAMPTEGRGVPSLVWLQACVSHMTQCRVSHTRQGNKGFRT